MASQKPGSRKARGPGDGNILSFFKPVVVPPPARSQTPAQTPTQTPTPTQPQTPTRASRVSLPPSTPLSPPPPSSSLLLSRTSTPAKPTVVEIAASDDEGADEGHGDYSDDSLEDLSTLLGPRKPPAAAAQAPPTPKPLYSPFVTPRAKRTAVEFHSSPLALMPRHKFDLAALAKDARLDDATTASSRRAQAAAAGAELAATSSHHDVPSGEAFVEIVKERGGQDAQKVLRAVQRSEPGHSRQRFCFFDAEYTAPSAGPPPRLARNGPWRLLTHESVRTREQHLVSGVPQMAVRKTKALPDELLQWILDELCIRGSPIIRHEYCNIVADCPEQVARLVTPQRLQELFIRLGASEQINGQGLKPTVSSTACEPYRDRDWSCLQSFLCLLAAISCTLSLPAVQYATQTLLLMSMDSFLIGSIDVLTQFGHALQCLVEAMPSSSWDSFCLKTCTWLSGGIKSQSIRANALLCLPLRSERVHDLRRRLAVEFLFADTAPARRRTPDAVTVRDFIDVLDGDGFDVTRQTDFAELKSCIIILDIAVDDGSVAAFADRQEERQFNDDVDRLASKLGDIWRRINDSGMKLVRTETKSVVEWVQQRLLHTVRTRKRVKKSVYDLAGEEQDPFVLRRQQDHMRNFLQAAPKTAVEGDSRVAGEGGGGGDRPPESPALGE